MVDAPAAELWRWAGSRLADLIMGGHQICTGWDMVMAMVQGFEKARRSSTRSKGGGIFSRWRASLFMRIWRE